MKENEMMSFISELENDKKKAEQTKTITETTAYKLNKIKQVKEEARDLCIDKIFAKLYKDAIPMEDETKDLLSDDLDAEIAEFIKAKQPKGSTYYVKEAIKKGSKPAALLMEKVDKLLTETFKDTALNIKDVPSDEIKFDIDDPSTEEKLNQISSTMQFDELSDAIKQNVKIAANSEINRVKEERMKIKEIEDELKGDENVTNESAINFELQKRGIVSPKSKLYQPTLFEGVMINKLNLVKESGLELAPDEMNQLAFVESTKEMTKLMMMKSLMMESFSNNDVKKLATNYATMKEGTNMLRTDRYDMLISLESAEERNLDIMLESAAFTEGANLEIRDEFKKFKAEYKERMKAIKSKMKEEKYDEAIKDLDKLKKFVHESYTKMEKIESTVGSMLFGLLLTGGFPFMLRSIISSLLSPLTLGVSAYVTGIVTLIEQIEVLVKDIMKRGFDPNEDLNLYKNAIKVRMNEYDRIIDQVKKIIKKKKEEKK